MDWSQIEMHSISEGEGSGRQTTQGSKLYRDTFRALQKPINCHLLVVETLDTEATLLLSNVPTYPRCAAQALEGRWRRAASCTGTGAARCGSPRTTASRSRRSSQHRTRPRRWRSWRSMAQWSPSGEPSSQQHPNFKQSARACSDISEVRSCALARWLACDSTSNSRRS